MSILDKSKSNPVQKKIRFGTVDNISSKPKGVKFQGDIRGDTKSIDVSRKGGLRMNDTTFIDLEIPEESEIPEYMIHWDTLTGRISDINTAISTLLTAHEEQFLAAFTHQMHKLQGELTKLKAHMDDRILEEKKNKKIMVLKEHLNYFRCQATRLEAERNKFTNKISTLEKELEGARRDRKYFESFLREERKAVEGKGAEGLEKERWWRTVVEELAKKKAGDVWREHQESKEASLGGYSVAGSSQQNTGRIREFRVGSAATTGRRSKKETGREYIDRKNMEIEELLGEQTQKRGLKWVRGTRGYTKREIKDFQKYREENEIIQIMKNCIYEVKRDIMLKNSKKNKPISRYQSAVDLIGEADDPSNFSIRTDKLNMKQKYDVVQKFLNHNFVLEKLRDVIDKELALSDTFLYPESNQINRDLSNLKNLRIGSAKFGSSTKSTAGYTGATQSRSKFFTEGMQCLTGFQSTIPCIGRVEGAEEGL